MADDHHQAATIAPGTLDAGAFAALLENCYATLVYTAAAEVGRNDAEDAVQRAALTALTNLDRFTSLRDDAEAFQAAFRKWMATIVRNEARNMRRSTTRYRLRLRKVADQTAPNAPAATNTRDEMDRNTDRDMDPKLAAAVDALPDRRRSCLLLRVVMGHSYAHIATLLEVPEATARSEVYRAREALLRVAQEVAHG